MQFIGWISILVGLFYFRKVAGLLLILIGVIVVYTAWKNKKSETESTNKTFQALVKSIGRKKQALKKAPESKSDFLIKALPKKPPLEAKKEPKKKSDWFIYQK